MSANKTFLMGRLTDKPKTKLFENSQVSNFSLAVDKMKKGDTKETDFFPIVAWGKLSMLCDKYLDKGSKVLVIGHLENRTWESDNIKRTITEVKAEEIHFASSTRVEKSENYATNNTYPIDNTDDLPF